MRGKLLFNMVRKALLRHLPLPKSIGARLHILGSLSMASLALLSVAAMLYVVRTSDAVTEIRDHDVALASASADAELLLEQHRRIVESAPVRLELKEINRDRSLFESLSERIEALLEKTHTLKTENSQLEFDTLVLSGRRVLYLASNFAQAEAVKALKAYSESADKIQRIVRASRATSVASAERSVAKVIESGGTLKKWIVTAGLVVLIVFLPIKTMIISNVVARIKGITDSMKRIAANDKTARIRWTRTQDEIGEMARALEIFKRNSEIVLSNSQEIEKLNVWFNIALNNMQRGLSMFDQKGRLLVCNSRYLDLYGLPSALGKPGTSIALITEYWCETALDEATCTSAKLVEWQEGLSKKISGGERFSEVHELPDGRTIQINTQPLDGGGWVDVHEDITEQREIESQVEQLVRADTLTGLANRRHFQERLAAMLENITERGGFALIWFDLDRFKAVNDTFGHPIGDALLRMVADRMRSTVRSGDFVARLGGDEFAILVPVGDKNARVATALANRLIRALSMPYEISGKMVSVGVSIGIALAPEHGREAEALIHNADMALYRAKTSGRGQCFVFNDHLEEEISERERAEADLRRALASDELLLHYQPIVDLGTGRVATCEALMRWQHPERGMVSPGEFIPLAEESGLIGVMGAWALQQACRDAMHWPPHVKVSVNVAAMQFTSTDMVFAVKTALQQSGLSAERLQLEVTETIMLKDTEPTLNALQCLREMGVSIALDDFGTGYASLSYLRSFPFDTIKIDQCFVRDIDRRNDCFAIVKAIVDLARSLGMSSVAEGIETENVLARVAEARCDQAQGYYFSRPVAACDLDAAFKAAEAKPALAA